MKNAKHAALYVRVSTDFQREEGYSLDAQKDALEAYCKLQGIQSYQVYEDGGFSGSNIDRPELQRMIENINKGLVSHCIVYKLDRLSRSQKDTLYLIEDVFNKNEVSFVSIKETIDTATPMGRLMIGILSAFAQLERENIRERTRMGMLERVKEGYWMGGGRTPFGYDYDDTQGILVPNKDADTVREMYRLYLQGYAPQKIADITGTKYDNFVMGVLKRKSNIGIIEYNGAEYKGRHEPIVDEKTYYETQLRMKERSVKHISSSDNLLTGLIYCGKCGAKMHYQVWSKQGKKICCYSQQTSKKYLIKDPDCNQSSLWADELEEIVLNDIFQLSLKQKEKKSDNRFSDSAVERLEEQIKIKTAELSRLYDLYAESGNEVLLKKIEEREFQMDSLKEEKLIQQQQEAMSQVRDSIIEKVEHLHEIWDLLSTKEKKNILNILIERIDITDNKIEIRYRL